MEQKKEAFPLKSLKAHSVRNKFFLIGKRAFPRDGFEIFMEAGEVIKTAFITKSFDAFVVFYQQLAGMTNS